MNNRPIYVKDVPTLQAAIDADKFHPGEWKIEDFMGFSELFEDGKGPIVFVNYRPESPGLRIGTIWVSEDTHRNARAVVSIVRKASERARDCGFEELRFSTSYDKLANFCTRVLKFKNTHDNEYALRIKEAQCK